MNQGDRIRVKGNDSLIGTIQEIKGGYATCLMGDYENLQIKTFRLEELESVAE